MSPAPKTSIYYETWGRALCHALGGIPDRWTWLVAWAQLEITEARFNLLATTLKIQGSTDFNDAGVQNYPTLDAGIEATKMTLCGVDAESRGYLEIVDLLANPKATFGLFRTGVSMSAWSGQPRDGDHYLIPDYDPSWGDRLLPGSAASA